MGSNPGHGLTLEAHGSMVVFMTAHYALQHAARVQAGDWVLVAGGAGGVGMAAVQIAAKAGARVIATASTPERAELLRTLGAEYVVDSRSLSAIDEVRQITGGHGADVVVNSAPGEAVVANLEVAAEFGRVVEVGKTEIFGGRLIDLAVFNKNLSLISMDLDRMMACRRDLALQVYREVLALIRAGKYQPLPARIMPVSQLADAFDQVARSTHLGRIVLDFTEQAPPVKPARPVTSYPVGRLLSGHRWSRGLRSGHRRLVSRQGRRHDCACRATRCRQRQSAGGGGGPARQRRRRTGRAG